MRVATVLCQICASAAFRAFDHGELGEGLLGLDWVSDEYLNRRSLRVRSLCEHRASAEYV